MKTFKKIVSVIMTLTALLALCACGKKNEPTVHKVDMGGYVAEIKSLDYILSEYLAEDQTIWFRLSSDKGKDSGVKQIYVFEPNGEMYYLSNPDYTLGELEQMEDADIAALVKEGYPKQIAAQIASQFLGYDAETVERSIFEILFNGYLIDSIMFDELSIDEVWTTALEGFGEHARIYLEPVIANNRQQLEAVYHALASLGSNPIIEVYGYGIGEYIAMLYMESQDWHYVMEGLGFNHEADEEALADLQNTFEQVFTEMNKAASNISMQLVAAYDDAAKSVSPCRYKLAIRTDSTGNNTASMVLAYQVPFLTGAQVYSNELNYQYPINISDGTTTNCTTVVYDSIYGGYAIDDDILYTRVNANAHFVLDQMGESDLPFDVKADSLFA